MNILIIEDDAAIRQELKLLLENALYQVTVLTEFHHVVEDILQMEPDLILLDVNLPQQSGFEICKSVRKTSDVPIIFLTVALHRTTAAQSSRKKFPPVSRPGQYGPLSHTQWCPKFSVPDPVRAMT